MNATADYAHKNLLLCSKHFSDSCFMNILVWDTVPSLFDVPNPHLCRSPKRKAPISRGLPPPTPPKKRKIVNQDEHGASDTVI